MRKLERYFNHEDFDIETEVETGNDDFVYGNYVDWDSFRKENEESLIEYFDVLLPWEKEISVSEYYDLINQDYFKNTSIIEDYDLDQLPLIEEADNISEVIIQFPSFNGRIISDIFDYFGVPSGVEYEYELPENLQYWHNMLKVDEDEYEYYKSNPIKFIDFENTINEIKEKVVDASDDLSKKSLILSSMIISESLFKSILVEKIPNETNISEFSKNILTSEINKKLRGNVKIRNGLFKELFGERAPEQMWTNLRNSLAHDIESSTIEGENILFNNLKTNEENSFSIEELFAKQLEFGQALQNIMESI